MSRMQRKNESTRNDRWMASRLSSGDEITWLVTFISDGQTTAKASGCYRALQSYYLQSRATNPKQIWTSSLEENAHNVLKQLLIDKK
jgi:hypothetical protein